MRTTSLAERIKVGGFAVARGLGAFGVVRESQWRAGRLLILCYHGVSQLDEHEGVPELYVPAALFRARLETLRRGGYAVMALGEALRRLQSGDLPPKTVALTFDDGFVDFHRVAAPILAEFGFPATVYVSTEYVELQLPAFPPILAYILWRALGRETSGERLGLRRIRLHTGTPVQRSESLASLVEAVRRLGLTKPRERDDFAGAVAAELAVDYEAIKRRRLFHLMTVDELASLDRALIDVQLHTHRHLQPNEPALFQREIADNRASLVRAGIAPASLMHFCYPNGEIRPELPDWLKDQGVVSATTCIPGIATRQSNPMLMPRFVDTQDVSSLKFEAWVSGIAALVPRRPGAPNLRRFVAQAATP